MEGISRMTRFFVVLFLSYFSNGEKMSAYQIDIPEDTPVSVVIGNIYAHVVSLTNIRHDLGLKCSILSQGNPFAKYFYVSQSTGDLILMRSLDREHICGHEELCLVKLHIAVSSYTSPVQIIRVDVIINDVNDNSPVFEEKEFHITIPGNTEINSTFPIPAAVDLDMGDNSRITYELSTENGIFTLRVSDGIDGTSNVNIILSGQLDNENITSYTMTVLAKDHGLPQKTGSVTVTVSVTAVNQPPVFSKKQYSVSVDENIPLNTSIATVTASDEDAGLNGQVTYAFDNKTKNRYSQLFSLDPVTGEIRVLQNIDYEEKSVYRLLVEASDNGSPTKTAQSVVVVGVRDLNDNKPDMMVDFLSGTDRARISEFALESHFVAAIKLTDRDSGDNAKVRCDIDEEHFQLVVVQENQFQIVLKKQLDRERQSQHKVIVSCQDGGFPQQNISQDIFVDVVDENDNSPHFLLINPAVSIFKSADIGHKVLQLVANDADADDNGRITYELQTLTECFVIDSTSGVITVSKSLYTLHQPEVTLSVMATDNGHNPKHSSTKVVISLMSDAETLPSRRNVLIVAIIVAITSTVASVLIILICWLKKSDKEVKSDEENPDKKLEKGSAIAFPSPVSMACKP